MQYELTDARLRALRPPEKGRIELGDARQRNLVLRLSADGAYSWSVAARTKAGARTRMTVGRWPEVGIAEARKRARAILAEIDSGGDPQAERRAAQTARAERANQPSVATRLQQWQIAKERDWSARHAQEVARITKRDIGPVLGGLPLVETTRADWVSLVAAKRKTAPAMASLLYRVASAFLGHAEAAGWIPYALLPRKGLAVLAPAVAARARVLSDDELLAVWRASGEIPLKPRVFTRLLILSAAREMEVADIAVGEIDLEAARWTIPAARAKNNQTITLPLGRLALAELAAVWSGETIAAGGRLLGIRGFSKLKTRLDALSQVDEWRFHDLRRTARTVMTRNRCAARTC